MDFNRNPMCACIAQLQGEELVILREFVMVDADTRMLALEVRKAFPRQEIICFPDPTGSRSQTSSLGLSDHAILRQSGFKVKSPKAPWAIRDKYAAVRLFLRDAHNRRRLKIDPCSKRLIRSISSSEVLAGHADHSTFPVLQVALVDEIPLLQAIAVQYSRTNEGKTVWAREEPLWSCHGTHAVLRLMCADRC